MADIPVKAWYTTQDRVDATPIVSYASTAVGYDNLLTKPILGNKTTKEAPLKPSEVNKKHKGLSGQLLKPGTRCHEYLALDVQISKLVHLRESLEKKVLRKVFLSERHEEKEHGSMPGTQIIPDITMYPSLWILMLTSWPVKGLLLLLPIVMPVTYFYIITTVGLSTTIKDILFLSDTPDWFFWGCLSIIPINKLLDLAQKRDLHRIFDPKETPMFCAIKRDTGMIRLFNNNEEWADLPFREFRGFNTMIPTGRGSQTRKLSMVHRPTGAGLLVGEGGVDGWHPALLWEFYQHYMDVSRPLPDVPEFEPYRHLDPTTRDWDKTHNRPNRYWRDMDPETYKQMVDEAITAAKAYPFLEPETAETQQWAPSGQGKHWFQMG